MHLSFLKHLQFGTDILFTFGPWGFLYGGYHPQTHLLSALVWFVLALIFWRAAWCAGSFAFKNELAVAAWIMVVASITAVPVVLNIDARLLCWPLLLLLLHFFGENRPLTITEALVIASMGLLSLIKFSVLIQCTAIVAIVGVDTLWRRKRFPWTVVLFGGSLLLFWLLAGQRLSSLAPFLRNSSQITSGYTEAVMESGVNETKYLYGFIVVAMAVAATAAFALWKRLRFFGVLPFGALCFLLFTAFKYGFVRVDAHQAVSALLLLLIALAVLLILWPILQTQKWPTRVAAGVPAMAAFLFAIFSFGRCEQAPLLLQMAQTLSLEKWVGPIELFYNGPLFEKVWQQYLADYREQFPLPPVKGDADLYSWNQMELFAHGISYRPRPIIQSYSVYTPFLNELNAAHLRTDKAAQNIIFDAGTIDNRYTSLEDSLSWPELLTRYDVQQVEFPFILLAKSEHPRQFKRTPLEEATIQFGETFRLPATSNTVLWAEIEVDPTPIGSLISALFKPPELLLETTHADGKSHAHRFVPGIARAGFVLSPFVKDCTSFATLQSSNWPAELKLDAVTAFSIAPTDGAHQVASYRNTIHVRLYQLDFPRTNLDDVTGFRQAIDLKEDIRKIKTLRQVRLKYIPDQGSVLGGLPTSAILLDRPQSASRLQLSFGLSGQTLGTNSITFRASTLINKQQAILLWSQHLNPQDKTKQQATIDLGNHDIANVLLETIPDRADADLTDAPLPYWSQLRFE